MGSHISHNVPLPRLWCVGWKLAVSVGFGLSLVVVRHCVCVCVCGVVVSVDLKCVSVETWISLWPWFHVEGKGRGSCLLQSLLIFGKVKLARSSDVNSQWSRLCPFSFLSFQRGKRRAFVALAFGEIK